MRNRFCSELPVALVLSGLLVATVMLLEPTKSAVANWIEIGLGFSELLGWLAVPAAIGFLVVAALAALSIAFAPRRTVPVLVAVYVALWAQGSLFVWDYGSFDGSPIDWSEHSGKGAIEVALIATALALAVTKPKWVRLALQLAALADQVWRHAPFPKKPPRSIATQENRDAIQSVNRYSRDLNVFIIVLDSLQSDIFSKAMSDPELRDAIPPGFTFYRNAVSQYGRTEFSLPSILTSKTFSSFRYTDGWMEELMAQSVPGRLVERGFDAVLVGFTHDIPCDSKQWRYKCLQNETLAEPGIANAGLRKDVSDLLSLALFRLAPHFLKPRVYDDGRFRVPPLYPVLSTREAPDRNKRAPTYSNTRIDLAVLDELTGSALASESTPQFRLLHFWAAHRPNTVDESCRDFGDEKRTGTTEKGNNAPVAATHCILSRLYRFLHRLDEIGVYDQSLIFVVADHGRFRGHWNGVPVFLVKPRGDRQPFRTSELPVSLCDLPSSIFDALAIEHDFECESIFSAEADRQQPRLHFKVGGRMKHGRRVVFKKFTVEGHSWLPESWHPLPRSGLDP